MSGAAHSSWLWLCLAALALVYQVYVSVRVTRAVAFSTEQKALQLLLVWLMPVVGAALVHWFVANATAPLPQPDRDFIAQEKPTLGQR
jgi:hypothetical protein